MANPFIRAVYMRDIQSDNVRYATLPAAAAGVAMVSDGAAAAWAWAAYVQVVTAAAHLAVTAGPDWLISALINVGAVETYYGDYAIATGAAGSEVDLAVVPHAMGLPGATALTTWIPAGLPVNLPIPIRVIGAPRVAGRLRKSTAASAAGFTAKIGIATALGT